MRLTAMILVVAATFARPLAPRAGAQGPSDAGQEQASGAEPDRAAARLQFGGWARASVEAMLPSGGVGDEHAGGLAVPHDALVARGLLNLRTRYVRGRSFEAVGTALLRYGLFQQASGGVTRDDASRSDVHAEIREAYVGFFRRDFDVRVGAQRIAWGHADTFSPNDVVNANDLRDPILNETELMHRPAFAVRVDVERSFGSLQVAVRPFLQPDHYDVYGTNWAFVQADAPAGYRGVLGVLSRQPNVSRDQAGQTLLVDGSRPGGLAGSQAGLRVDWRAGAVDVTHYYDYGYNGTPDFRVDAVLVERLDVIDWANVSPLQLTTVLAGVDADQAVGSRWQRRHHVGFDLGTTRGPFLLRLDAAYQNPGLFYDRALNGWLSPTVQAVFGAEYQTGDLGRTILVEGRYRRLQREPPEGGLLFAARDTADAAVVVRWTWMNRLEFEARGVVGRGPTSYVFRPQLTWKRENLALRLGLLWLGGEDFSYGDWYAGNRSIYLMLRRAF